VTWLAAVGLPLALLALGSRLAGHLTAPDAEDPGQGPGHRAALAWTAGALAFYLVLLLLDAVHLPWTRPVLLVTLLLLALAARRLPPLPRRPWHRPAFAPGWGDSTAALALLAFALLAPTLWITLPDFYYHWGMKAQRFALAGGIDHPWLAQPWNGSVHPDYPNLLPALYAATVRLANRFEPSSLMLWTVLFYVLLLASAADTLRRTNLERPIRQGTVALLGLFLATYSIGYRMAGGADGLIALALILALPALLFPLTPPWKADLQIALAATLAAAAKIEGVPLAAILLLVHTLRQLPAGLKPSLRALVRTTPLPLAIILPWFLQARHDHLFQPTNAGPFDPARLRPVASAMLDALQAPELHGLPWLAALLPLLLLARRTRPLFAVCAAQLLVYLWAYVASTLEPRFYVLSNFARLLFHLIPTILLGTAIATGTRPAGPRRSPPDDRDGRGSDPISRGPGGGKAREDEPTRSQERWFGENIRPRPDPSLRSG
jgi:hypothetical protein